jgi:Lon protease-like protein
MSFTADVDLRAPVPLFPLPNVVLLPRAVLPLHIFEDRYRLMMADTLVETQQIAMALLKPGWETHYHGRPEVEPVVCVGRILQHERLADGRYNLLLQGVARATIARHHDDGSYRRADLELLAQSDVLEIDLADQRRRLRQLFTDRRVTLSDLAIHLEKLFDSSVPTPDLADILAFSLLTNIQQKQSLLAEPDVLKRVERTIAFMHRAYPEIPRDAQGRALHVN